jgi:hypothetical protein
MRKTRSAACLAALALTALTVLASPSLAQVVCGGGLGCPDAGNSTIPSLIVLVGHDGSGTPDPAGQFMITIRDLANNPLPNVTIRLQLTASDVGFCASQAAGLVVHLPDAVEGVTDARGQFIASVKGMGVGAASHTAGGVQIYANGVLQGEPNIAAIDLDGSGGAGINDLAVWLGDFGSGPQYLRDDYDGSGSIGVNDLATWLAWYGRGLSAVGCAP